jgi:hypothetical protein
MYIHQRGDWPKLRWDQEKLTNQLAAVRHRQGRLIGRMEGLGFRLREEAVLSTLTQDVLKSSEIEGEILNVDQVRSSLGARPSIRPCSRIAPGCRWALAFVAKALPSARTIPSTCRGAAGPTPDLQQIVG